MFGPDNLHRAHIMHTLHHPRKANKQQPTCPQATVLDAHAAGVAGVELQVIDGHSVLVALCPSQVEAVGAVAAI